MPAKKCSCPPDAWSYSRLDKFNQCPWRYYQEYILGRKSPQTYPLALGSAAHSLIETVAPITGLGTSWQTTFEIFAGIEVGKYPEFLSESAIPLLAKMAGFAYTHFELNKTQLEFHIDREQDGEHFHGWVDCGEESGRMIDWKSGKTPFYPEETKQLTLYVWMRSQNQHQPTETALVFVRPGIEKPIRSAIVTPEQAERTGRWAVALAKEIRTRLARGILAFPATSNQYCRWCHLANECPLKTGVIATPEPQPPTPPVTPPQPTPARTGPTRLEQDPPRHTCRGSCPTHAGRPNHSDPNHRRIHHRQRSPQRRSQRTTACPRTIAGRERPCRNIAPYQSHVAARIRKGKKVCWVEKRFYPIPSIILVS